MYPMPSWASTSASVVLALRTIPVSLVVATSSPLGPPVRSSGTNGSRRPFDSYDVPSPCGTTGAATSGGVLAADDAPGGGTRVAGAAAAGAVGAAATGWGVDAAGGGGGEPPHAPRAAHRPARLTTARARVTTGLQSTPEGRRPAWELPAPRGGPESVRGSTGTCTWRVSYPPSWNASTYPDPTS